LGWTDRPAGDYSPQAQAKRVFALLAELGVDEPVAGVAHSWGSSVALAMALGDAERVRRIAIYDGWIYEEQLPTFFLWARASSLGEVLFWLFYKEQPAAKMTNAFYDKAHVTQDFVEAVDRALDRPGTSAAALAAVRGQRFALYQDQYRTIDAPTLLLWGREDAVSPVWVGERLAADMPQATLVVYPRCGHFPMIEAMSASNAELARFLEEDLDEPSPDTASAPAPRSEREPSAEADVEEVVE